MIALRMVAVATLVGLAACGGRSIEFDPTFTDAERSTIIDGFGEWPETALGDLHVVRVTDATRVDHPECIDSKQTELGMTSRSKGIICLFVDDMTRDEAGSGLDGETILRAVSAHEYGHWLGLEHSSDEDPSCMHAMLTPSQLHVTAFDDASLSKVQR